MPGPTNTLQPTAPQINATLRLGPMTIGFSLQLILYGISICCYGYYYGSPAWQKDSLAIKLILCTVFALNTLQLAIYLADMFHYVTWQQRDMTKLEAQTWMDCILPVPEGFIAVLVQSLLARRAILMVPRRPLQLILATILGILIFGNWVGTIMASIVFFVSLKTGRNVPNLCRAALSMFLIGAAVTDCLISTTLWVTLRTQVHGFRKRTDNVVKRVIKQAWRTAAFTAIVAVIGTAIFLYFDGIYVTISQPFLYVLPSLYALSLFSVLASRQNFNNELTGVGCMSSDNWPDITLAVASQSQTKSKQNVMTQSGS